MATSGSDNEHGSLPRLMVAYGHVGIMFPVAIGIGFVIGDRIDRWLDTSPWIALLGFLLGVVAALRNLLRAVDRQERLEAEAARELQEREPE